MGKNLLILLLRVEFVARFKSEFEPGLQLSACSWVPLAGALHVAVWAPSCDNFPVLCRLVALTMEVHSCPWSKVRTLQL